MRHVLKAGLAAGVLIAAAAPAHAEAFYIWNKFSNPIWVTGYNAVRQGVVSFCLLPNSNSGPIGFSGTSKMTTWGGGAYWRYEYKSQPGCKGSTYHDSGYGPIYGTSGTKDINIYAPQMTP